MTQTQLLKTFIASNMISFYLTEKCKSKVFFSPFGVVCDFEWWLFVIPVKQLAQTDWRAAADSALGLFSLSKDCSE